VFAAVVNNAKKTSTVNWIHDFLFLFFIVSPFGTHNWNSWPSVQWQRFWLKITVDDISF